MKKYTLLVIMLVGLASQILFSHNARTEDVMLFHIDKFGNYLDTQSYQEIAQELRLRSRIVDYHFRVLVNRCVIVIQAALLSRSTTLCPSRY